MRAVVAIPARDEVASLAACLDALATQMDIRGRPLPSSAYGVVLLLNNCLDSSRLLARMIARTFPAALRIVERRLPPEQAHAGGARRIAMDIAADWLDESGGGLLLTTDADSRVGSTWIAENLAAVAAGAEAIAGDIALDPQDEARLPAHLRHRGVLENRYSRQISEIGSLLDPEAHNPWPRHTTISGASLAVTLSAYRGIGGLPALPLGEDKALVRALQELDARVRFSPTITVVTSGRLSGRAKGGVADTMRYRSQEPMALCDDALEPIDAAVVRARCRGWLRKSHATGGLNRRHWAKPLGLSQADAIELANIGPFGTTWGRLERIILPRCRRLSPLDLPHQIRCAERVLAKLRRQSPAADEIEAKRLMSFPEEDGRDASELR
jgi:hypothetical protein